MNKRLFFIFFSIAILVFASGESTYAQLLEDRNKLKTAKRVRKPFSLFKKNVKKPAKTGKKPDVVKAYPTRTTKDIAGKGDDFKASPRYTQDVAGKGYKKGKVSPRFSSPSNWKEEKKAPPRFTQETAGQGYDKMKVNPRFSVNDNSKNKPVKPRYSKAPAYVSSPASGQRKGFMPTIQLFQPKPRYKQGKESNFYGPKVKAVYSPSNSMAKHNKSVKSYQKHISKGGKSSPYAKQTEYLVKTKKMKKPKNAHPSANYLSAKYDNSAILRNSKRKFNITWVRTFGNKTQPKGVKKKPAKPKFDKDEKDIWNNQEREYTRN